MTWTTPALDGGWSAVDSGTPAGIDHGRSTTFGGSTDWERRFARKLK